MKNLTKILLKLIGDKKIDEQDCANIIMAIMRDNIDAISNGISNKQIEPISQITADKLIENLKHCEK